LNALDADVFWHWSTSSEVLPMGILGKMPVTNVTLEFPVGFEAAWLQIGRIRSHALIYV